MIVATWRKDKVANLTLVSAKSQTGPVANPTTYKLTRVE